MNIDNYTDFDINLLIQFFAKSDGTTLFEHINSALVLANQISSIYGLDLKTYKSLCKCIIYHDLGKVTADFQDNMLNIYNSLTMHEILSTSTNELLDSKRVSITPHHKSIKKLEGSRKSINRLIRHEILSASINGLLDSERLAIISHHKSIKKIEGYRKNIFYEQELKQLAEKLGVNVIDIRPFISKIAKTTCPLIKDLDNILLKGYLQYCDHISSAGIKQIEIGFSVFDSYNYPKLNSIQVEILNMKHKEDILIVGPTGIGKTAASLYWSNVVQNKDKSKRIYYLLPFTASINALYKDMKERNISVAMMHHKAEYYLSEIEQENEIKELYNLFKKSVKQINISTIYQIIKSIFACKRFEMLLAQFKNSIFIIDEIHCFDLEQTALLLTTLKFFKEKLHISICIMSASIPSKLQELICSELGINKIIRASKEDYKVRHKLHRVRKDIFSSIEDIKEDLSENKKVIVCVNKVSTAQKLYELLKEYNPTLIHGMMNARDREKYERNLNNCNLLIGTQAIEVSLDIDFDKMHTEIAPFDSLLQRFGRVNRYGAKEVSSIFIYNQDSKVYKSELLERTDTVINEIIINTKGLIIEELNQEYLDKVYTHFDFDMYYKKRSDIEKLISFLKVGTFSNTPLDNMFSRNTITLLPISLLDEYKSLTNAKEFLKANALLVNVKSYGIVLEHSKLIKDLGRSGDNIYVTDLIYDDRGLVFEVDSSTLFI